MSTVRDTRLFWLAWGVCTLGAVATIWGVRFLPMQDYPEHLFYAFALATKTSPDLDWARHFEIALAPGPYSLFYALASWFVNGIGAESAGKVAVSAYVLGLALYVAVEARERAEAPWVLLLIVPLAFSQPYYMGFTNYLLTIPVLLFALRSHSRLLDGDADRLATPLATQLICGLLFFFGHFSMILVYLGLTTLRMIRRFPSRIPGPALLGPGAMAAGLIAWLSLSERSEELRSATQLVISWWPISDTLAYLALPFTGMGIGGLGQAIALASWALILLAVGVSAWRGRRGWPGDEDDPRTVDRLFDFGATCFAYLTLPFWLVHYSYVNVRLAPLVYLLGAVALSRLPIRGPLRLALVGGIVGSCGVTAGIHRAADAEVREILPLLELMEPNRPIHALYPDASSRTLDPAFFYQHHSHEHAYFHVLRGGGVSPSLFPTDLIPVHYRDARAIPFANRGDPFRVARAAAFYPYLLVRGRHAALEAQLSRAYRKSRTSGPWTLWVVAGDMPAQ